MRAIALPALAFAQGGDSSFGKEELDPLTTQGKDASGGAKSYLVGGRMTGGYAFVAWPVKWGDTGVMSFIIDKTGAVLEKDLGPDTDAPARAMTVYDPGPDRTKVPLTK